MSSAEPDKGQWIIEDWQGQTRFALNVLSWLHDEQSAYQRIQVVDTEVYGRGDVHRAEYRTGAGHRWR
jgi:hypothetical protein